MLLVVNQLLITTTCYYKKYRRGWLLFQWQQFWITDNSQSEKSPSDRSRFKVLRGQYHIDNMVFWRVILYPKNLLIVCTTIEFSMNIEQRLKCGWQKAEWKIKISNQIFITCDLRIDIFKYGITEILDIWLCHLFQLYQINPDAKEPSKTPKIMISGRNHLRLEARVVIFKITLISVFRQFNFSRESVK